MTILVFDDFNGSAGDDLNGHTPDTGPAWVEVDASSFWGANVSPGPELDGSGALLGPPYASGITFAITPNLVIPDESTTTVQIHSDDLPNILDAFGGFTVRPFLYIHNRTNDLSGAADIGDQDTELVQLRLKWEDEGGGSFTAKIGWSVLTFLDGGGTADEVFGSDYTIDIYALPIGTTPVDLEIKVQFNATEVHLFIDSVEITPAITRGAIDLPPADVGNYFLLWDAMIPDGLLEYESLTIEAAEEVEEEELDVEIDAEVPLPEILVFLNDDIDVEIERTVPLPHLSMFMGAPLQPVEAECVFADGSVIEQECVLDARFLEFVEQECVLTSDIRAVIEQECVFDSPILDYDVLEAELVIVSPILGSSAQIVSVSPTATIRGRVIPLEQGSVSYDQGQFAWTCQLTLADPRHWQLFGPDDAFTVSLPGEDYAFLVDDVSFSRAGQVDRAATVAGIGPGARYASPRAQKLSRTWDAPVLATAVVEELFGEGVVQWEILDWAIPAFRLGMQDQAPMDVLQRLAAAAGATVQPEPDGTLRVRYLYPVSVPQYESAAPDHVYFDAQHNFTSQTGFSPAQLVDKLRILDVEPGAGRDSIEFEQDKTRFTRGTLRVFPSPWRTDVRVEHTSDARVSAALVGEETEELTETVEVLGGKGSVAKPIYQVLELEWLYVDLSGVAFETDSTSFTTTHPTLTESLLRITYRTRFIEFEASAFPEAEVQFLVKEAA